MGVAWPPLWVAVAPASAPAPTEAVLPPSPHDLHMDDPQPCPGFLCLHTGHMTHQPCPASSSQLELGTFCGDRREEAVTLWTEAWTQDGLPSSSSLGWHQGPGIEPCEDLGLSPNAPCHVFITSKRRDLASCPPNSSHHSPIGELPPASDGDRGGCPGWGRPPVHILRTNPPDINSRWFRFYFKFFVLIFLNKNFHFKHIYTEGICAVYWGSWI